MKKFSILALVLLAAAAAGAQPPDSQPPKQLRIPGLIEKEEEGAFLILGRIFPVGWSPEGLFAYVYEAPDEACGCYFFELIVQDLETDKVAWHYDYDSDKYEFDSPSRFDDLEAIWKAKGQEFAAKLRELGIVRRDDPKLELFAASTAKLRSCSRSRKKATARRCCVTSAATRSSSSRRKAARPSTAAKSVRKSVRSRSKAKGTCAVPSKRASRCCSKRAGPAGKVHPPWSGSISPAPTSSAASTELLRPEPCPTVGAELF